MEASELSSEDGQMHFQPFLTLRRREMYMDPWVRQFGEVPGLDHNYVMECNKEGLVLGR